MDVSEAFRTGPSINWPELKAERRTVLLAEAWAGKTEEIRQAAARRRASGDHAFFLRLEHVADDLDTAFEVGDLELINGWTLSEFSPQPLGQKPWRDMRIDGRLWRYDLGKYQLLR